MELIFGAGKIDRRVGDVETLLGDWLGDRCGLCGSLQGDPNPVVRSTR